MPLLLSGTAAVVGHASQHGDSLEAQLDEVLINLQSLVDTARQQRPALPAALGPGSPLKVYVRDAAEIPAIRQALARHLPPEVAYIVLHAEVCRRDLRVEIDGVHGA